MKVTKKKGANKGKESTRNLLLDTAAKFMTDQGSIDFTLSDIGELSGMNTALIRYYFGNKRGMMFALVERTLKGELTRLDRLMATDLPPEEKMRLHVSGIINTYFAHPFVNRLLHHIARVDKELYADRISVEITAPIIKAQNQIIKEGVDLGVFRDLDPMLCHIYLNGIADALFSFKAVLQNNFGMSEFTAEIKDRYINEVLEILFKGISKP